MRTPFTLAISSEVQKSNLISASRRDGVAIPCVCVYVRACVCVCVSVCVCVCVSVWKPSQAAPSLSLVTLQLAGRSHPDGRRGGAALATDRLHLLDHVHALGDLSEDAVLAW